MANDKDHTLRKILQEPIDEKDKDLLTFTLCTPIRQPEPPQPPPPPPPQQPPQPPLQLQPLLDTYLNPMYGMILSQTQQLSAISPFAQFYNPLPLPQNPNPNPNPNPNLVTAQAQPAPVPEQQARPGPIRRPGRTRSNKSAQALRSGKSQTVPAPYPWATSRRANLHTLKELTLKGIEKVTGEMQCRRCEKRFSALYDVRAEFLKLATFIAERKDSLRDRSPQEWDNPKFPDCKLCGQKGCAKPVIAAKKRDINWLFLLLGGFLNLCSLEQLKYFCKHTGNHRTGAKNRLLYLTYLGLCKQLDPSGPFEALG